MWKTRAVRLWKTQAAPAENDGIVGLPAKNSAARKN
jgi:hypothetical protein